MYWKTEDIDLIDVWEQEEYKRKRERDLQSSGKIGEMEKQNNL